MTFASRFQYEAQGVLRIAVGLLFMQHGAQKLFGWLGGFGGQPGATAELFSLPGLAGVLEFAGGLLIVIGLLTRAVALVLAAEMLVAYFMAHLPRGFWPILNRGELALLYMFAYLFFTAAGPGAFSVDGAMGRERRPSADRRPREGAGVG